MARIIGEAAIRLRAEGKGLALEIRRILTTAIREGSAGISTDGATDGIVKDAEKSGSKVSGIFGRILRAGQTLGAGLAGALASGAKLALMGAAAGVALAGVSSLVTGVIGLVGVLGQAAGAAGLLPAAFIAIKAVSATLKLALDGVGESFTALASGDAAAFAASLKDLAPSARGFMTEIAKVKPAFDKIKLNLQQTAFEGLGKAIAPLAQRYLPIMNEMFQSVGGTANAAAKELIGFANDGEVAGQTALLTQNIGKAFRELVPAIAPATSALLDIGQVGSGFLPGLTAGVANLAVRFGDFIRNAAATGQLQEFFQNALNTLKQLGQVLANFGSGLANVFKAAETAGGGFLNSLLSISEAFNEFTESASGQQALIGFFTAMRQIIAAVLPVVTSLAGTIGRELAPILGNLASTIGPALLPVVEALGPALKAAAPGIAALASGFAEFLKGLAPLLPVLGQLAAIIGGTLGAVFKALAPVLVQVAKAIETGLAKVLPTLMPVIDQFAVALGDVLIALVPMIPVFFQLLGAILPILPPLLQLVAALLPPLVSLITALTPIVTALAQVFAAVIPIISQLAQIILGVLLPPIELIATVVAKVAAIVSNVFTAMSGFITTIMSAIGAVISGIWGTIVGVFSKAVSSIGDFVNSAFTKARQFISDAMGNIGRAVSDGITNVVRFFRDLPGNILSAIGNFARLLYQAGADLLNGLWDGIKSMFTNLINRIKNFATDLKNAFLAQLGIRSPSTVFRAAGVDLMDGLRLGIGDEAGAVLATVTNLANSITDAFNPSTDGGLSMRAAGLDAGGAATAAAAGGGLTLYQTNVMQPGVDITRFAAEVWRRGGADLASGNSSLNVAQQPLQNGIAMPGSVVSLGV